MKRRNQGLRTTRAASLALAALMASAVAAPPALADAVTPSWSFTNCGKAGRFGPSLADCQSAYSDKAWAQDAQQFRVVDGVQYWTVPATARYSVTVQGASSSGKAARFTTHVDLKAGQSLKVLVGQQPTCWQSCGGGGGTYVATSTNEPIAVAGGGGGRGRDAYSQAIGFATPDARFVTSGGEGRGGWSRTDVQSNGGVNGQGGGSAWCGTGGGGFYGRGAGGCWGDNGGRGGRSFIEGGIGDWSQCGVEDGGFGGGGAGHGCWDGGGGGGGGYSGGGGVDNGYTCGEVCANRAAGGGGSFWAGTPAEGKSLTTGAGRVDIRFSDQATAVRATSIGAEQVRVSWASPSDVDQAGGFVESLRVFASTDGGTTWTGDWEAPALATSIDLEGLRCAGQYIFRVTAQSSQPGASAGLPSAGVIVGSDAPRFCTSEPRVTVPGKTVTVTLAGLTAPSGTVSTGYVLLSVNGADHRIAVAADGTAQFTYAPAAAGKGKVKALFTAIDQKTYRLRNVRFETSVWTAGVRLPRSATAGRSVNVTASSVFPGEQIDVTWDGGSGTAVADARGLVSIPVLFNTTGLNEIQVSYRGTVLASGTVTVSKRK